MKKIIETTQAPSPIGPYSQAVSFNNIVFLSGQIAIDPTSGALIMDSIEEETEQVMQNIAAVLKEAGSDFDNVIKCSIFLSDMNNFSVVNEVYGKYFPKNPPARECVQVSVLPKNVNVEISVIAHL